MIPELEQSRTTNRFLMQVDLVEKRDRGTIDTIVTGK